MRKGIVQTRSRALAVAAMVVSVVAVLGVEQTAEAQEPEIQEEEIASLQEGPAVRRQLLHRSGRVEIAPQATFSANDPFVRNAMPGLSVGYYLNNAFGITGSVQFGALQLDTSLRESLDTEMAPAERQQTSYTRIGWAADAGVVYVPMFGKFTVMDSVSTHYDFHLFGGMSVLSESAVPAVEGGEIDPQMEGVRPGGLIGGGLRFFVSEMVSINFQMRNYIVARSEAVSQGDADLNLGNTVLLTTGVGIFWPGDVKVSR